jgi:hypothetical protein
MSRIAFAALLLTACAAQPPATNEPANAAAPQSETQPMPQPPPTEPTGECDASKARELVGRPATAENGAEAQRLTGARTIRWIRPGDMVTMDYRTDRLNINVNANGRIEELNCG